MEVRRSPTPPPQTQSQQKKKKQPTKQKRPKKILHPSGSMVTYLHLQVQPVEPGVCLGSWNRGSSTWFCRNGGMTASTAHILRNCSMR